ncbi:MAG: SIR2 family protein, partial [Deltaproteobacteria bacterium]|nr:SIR2 family protein [Deltaproteobacteria bacterium]
MSISDIYDNQERIDQLRSLKGSLVPFIGAGFSRPLYPDWADFLEQYFQNVREEFFLPEDEKKYLELKNGEADNKLELMADLLIRCTDRGKFEEEINKQFDEPTLPEMKNKFDLLHRAFSKLKITTNFDALIENSATGINVEVCRGNRPEELERLFTQFEQNSLLKIHGGIRDVSSIILSTEQYANLYGHATEFDSEAQLPKFLERVFTNSSVLFIGCSLLRDRTLMVMEKLAKVRPHFAIMKRPEEKKELVKLNRRLSQYRIKPIWMDDFAQIEELLQILAPEDMVKPLPAPPDHGVPFVGREKELKQIKEKLEDSNGGLQMISGRLFNLDGAGGVGKTTLAIEAAKEYAHYFKDGVLPPIRVDEHTPMSFVAHLAYQFDLKMEEPPDQETAQRLVTAILKDRHALLILDNAIKWQNLRYMLPTQTRSTILVTTRNREIFKHIRLQYQELRADEVSLENFSEKEALALFKKMLGDNYRADEESNYLEISAQLGFLPLALRQAISLMLFGPHYTAKRLLEKLGKEDRLKLLSEGHAAEGSDDRTIETVFDLSTTLLSSELIETMEYLAACALGRIPLSFLRRLSGDDDMERSLEKLYAYSWCERRETEDERAYELHQLVRELMHKRYGNRFSRRFIDVIHNVFTDDSIHFSEKEPLMTQLNEALLQATAIRDEKLINWLYDLYYFLTYRGYYDFYVRLTHQIEKVFPEDKWALRAAYG